VLRAHSPFWIPSSHFPTKYFVCNGIYIPKNAALILDLYDIHHNEERYPDSYACTFPPLILFEAERTSWNRFVFNPDRFLGDTLTSDESSKLSNAMDRDRWAFGVGYMPKPFSPCLILQAFLADTPSPFFLCFRNWIAVAVSARVSTSQNGRCGLQSHGYFGPMIVDPYPMSRFPWRNSTASMDACRCHIVSLSHRDMIEFMLCWRRSRKSF